MQPRLILRSILQLNTGFSGIPYSFGLQQSSVMPIYACHTTSRFAGGLIIVAALLTIFVRTETVSFTQFITNQAH